MAVVLSISGQVTRQVYATLGGATTDLSAIIAQTRAARSEGKAVEWVMEVTQRTVHFVEGVFRVAQKEGAVLSLNECESMSERHQAFLDDFKKYCLAAGDEDKGSKLPRVAHEAAEVAEELSYSLLGIARMLMRAPAAAPTSLRSVLVIGAYGGDHVGDAAILGGVLLGLHERWGVTDVHLLSHRPGHSRRLARGLSTPVTVRVSHYNAPAAAQAVSDVDAVVVAGGPMMDLPRVLAKHLVAVGAAAKQKKPLIIDRIGIGPFKYEGSKLAARLLLKQAAYISTRTKGAAAHSIAHGLDVKVARDPAFDYLASRKELTRLTDEERESVDSVLEGTAGRVLIGINIRPIIYKWGHKGPEFARKASDDFLDNLAAAMKQFSARSAKPVTFVFFPMNPIQFGMSDLHSSFLLRERLDPSVDYRVWQADPDVDGVLYFLRKLDASISVRFHACIFSLSQNMPVLGIDYYPGEGGKVQQLFQDLGKEVDVRIMDDVPSDWIVNRLEWHLGRARN
jgi:polysaccharide pyruvyl transferase WcaK-like protein